MANLLAIRTALRMRCRISVADVSDNDMDTVILDAVRLHNEAYVNEGGTDVSVPTREVRPCWTLAWADLCDMMASYFAKQANNQGQVAGYGTDRNTPYYKFKDLKESLMKSYSAICNSLGLAVFAGVGGAVTSSVVSEEVVSGNLVRFGDGPSAPEVKISYVTSTIASDGTIILAVSFARNDSFAQLVIYHLEGATSIIQPWVDGNSTNGRGIEPSAESVSITDPRQTQVKLLDLSTTPAVQHRFVAKLFLRSGESSISNELVFTQP